MTNTRKFRASLLLSGYTIRRFATEHGFSRHTVKSVIAGRRGKGGGKKSAEILAALKRLKRHAA